MNLTHLDAAINKMIANNRRDINKTLVLGDLKELVSLIREEERAEDRRLDQMDKDFWTSESP